MGMSRRVTVKDEAEIGQHIKYNGCPVLNLKVIGIIKDEVYTIADVKQGEYATLIKLEEPEIWINSRYFYHYN